ncbi:MAG: 4Fe-4S dicluster domain-containing protein [Phycisphaerae bacterium]|jgi:protein NrfC|nr:4Fe-4S dicluster domain-containing protein [Phycisphaerae bacterium]
MTNHHDKMKQGASKSGTLSRRSFLQNAGTAAASAVGGSYIICGVVEIAGGSPIRKGAKPAPSTGYILVDANKCQGCVSCMLACSLIHEGVENQSLSRIQILQNSFVAFPQDVAISQCRQCVDPACVKKCPENALSASKAKGNVRMVDAGKCIGCGMCFDACPHTPSRSVVAPDRQFKGKDKARKCDLCTNARYHWDKRGGGVNGLQACVAICPMKAIKFTTAVPAQKGDKGYLVNLRNSHWNRRFGFPEDRRKMGDKQQ